MQRNNEDLTGQCNSLADRYSLLVGQIQRANNTHHQTNSAARLNTAILPDSLVSSSVFIALRDDTIQLLNQVSFTSFTDAISVTSLEDLGTLINTVKEKHVLKLLAQEHQRNASLVLNQVMNIVEKNGYAFDPLSNCQQKAKELLNRVSSNEWQVNSEQDIRDFSIELYPFTCLLDIIKAPNTPDDDMWNLLESVAQAFGKPLALSLSRGTLVIPSSALGVLSNNKSMPLPEAACAEQSKLPGSAHVNIPENQALLVNLSGDGSLAEPKATQINVEIDKFTVAEANTEEGNRKLQEEIPYPGNADILQEKKRVMRLTHSPEAERVQVTAEYIAKSIILQGEFENPELLWELIWCLLLEDRLDIAYQLTRCVENRHPRSNLSQPVELIRALLLATHCCDEVGEISIILGQDFEALREVYTSDALASSGCAINLLLAAASLRPSLISPSTNAPSILLSLHKDGCPPTFYKYCQVIAEYGGQSRAINHDALEVAGNSIEWQRQVDVISEKVGNWLSEATRVKFPPGSATSIWQKLLEPKGSLYLLLYPISIDDNNCLQELKREVEKLSNPIELKRLLDRTGRGILGHRGQLDAKAFNQIRIRIREAVDLAQEWLRLQQNRPDHQQTYGQQQLQELLNNSSNLGQPAMEELALLRMSSPACRDRVAALMCERAIESVERLFSLDVPGEQKEPDSKHLLNACLLLLQSVELNDEWDSLRLDSHSLIVALVMCIADTRYSWMEAFESHCASEVRDHEATRRILEYLDAFPDPSIVNDELRDMRQKHLRECQDALLRDVDEARRDLERSAAIGLVTEDERTKYAAEIDGIESQVPRVLRFHEMHDRLLAVRRAIEKKKILVIDGIRHRMQVAGIKADHPAYERICGALTKGDVLTANEYISLALDKKRIPESTQSNDQLMEFFPKKLEQINDYMNRERTAISNILSKIKAHHDFAGVTMRHVPLEQSKDASRMLETWFTASRQKKIDPSRVDQIITSLGLTVTRVTPLNTNRHQWFELSAEPVRNREECPVPFFGSLADGHYRVLCLWGKPTEDQILNIVGETAQEHPTLVFYFGRMSSLQRRDLAYSCRLRRRTFIVVDDLLIIHLCGQQGSRLPSLLNCALPFTFLEPYVVSSNLLPPELFFGRISERNSIIDPMGSCFIYGGRLLGKTAILRDVARTFIDRDRGRIALYLDLKANEIGLTRGIDDIWELLATELKKVGVLPSNTPAQIGSRRLLEHIYYWLEKDDQRRVLILLDEADRFLESDAKESFTRCDSIKGLMDKTGRRFKVVFAGLHNVQRTSRQENQPLAHYGEPICIGPMLDNGEWREARNLIEMPLRSIGYRFESEDLVTRLLSQTNYYPSLIQIYCHYLLRHVDDPQVMGFDREKCPPYVITSRHIEDAYLSWELRKAIGFRFMLTLDLDLRYKVIALLLALESICYDSETVDGGFQTAWIRQRALELWPQGFINATSPDAFRVLLDEMVGLGVLRIVDESRYALRSANIVPLLGTQEEIETSLQECSKHDATPQYEAGTFRAAFRRIDGKELWRRSPLSAQQVSELRGPKSGVSVIFGCKAAGIDDLQLFLEDAFGKEFVVPSSRILDFTSFYKQLELLSERRKDNTTLLLVPSAYSWDGNWVQKAVERIESLGSKKSFARVVFVANPELTWALTNHDSKEIDSFISAGVTLFSLSPWHDAALQQWLEDCDFGVRNKEDRDKITSVAGNWPLLLYEYYERCQRAHYQTDKILVEMASLFQSEEKVRSFMKDFGLEQIETTTVLHNLAVMGELSLEELIGLSDDFSQETTSQVVKWADLLRLINPVSEGKLHVDPIVGHILESLSNG